MPSFSDVRRIPADYGRSRHVMLHSYSSSQTTTGVSVCSPLPDLHASQLKQRLYGAFYSALRDVLALQRRRAYSRTPDGCPDSSAPSS